MIQLFLSENKFKQLLRELRLEWFFHKYWIVAIEIVVDFLNIAKKFRNASMGTNIKVVLLYRKLRNTKK